MSFPEPGLDKRHADHAPRPHQIQQKRGDTLNRNLPQPIPQFPHNTRLDTMRERTGQTSVAGVRSAAAKGKK